MPVASHIAEKMDHAEFGPDRLVACLTEDEDDDAIDQMGILPDADGPTFRLIGASAIDDATRLVEMLTDLDWVVQFVIPPEGAYTCWRCDFDTSKDRLIDIPDIEKRAVIALRDAKHAVKVSFHGPVECDLTWSETSDSEFSLLVFKSDLVNRVNEDEDDDAINADDLIVVRNGSQDMGHLRGELVAAGFTVDDCKIQAGVIYVACSWPYTSSTMKVNGAKRASEIIKKYFPIRYWERKYRYTVKDGAQIVAMYLVRPVETDAALWEVSRDHLADAHPNASLMAGFYTIRLDGEAVGNMYSAEGDSTAQRVRDEMARLDTVFPFVKKDWKTAHTDFGDGPAIDWWRNNRFKLDPTARHNYHIPDELLRNPRPPYE
jgi:hypothetical protein